MKQLTKEEWHSERVSKFGEDPAKAKFVCPKCKNVASYEDFKASTINTNINIDFGTPTQNCLGRYSEKIDCDWAAYGLFGTLGDGINILSEDSSFEVFDFADIEVAE
jgi:hypothetical protein